MAGGLKASGLASRRQEDSSFRSKPLATFKTAGLVAHTVASTPDGITPRKYIKVLHHAITTLDKHRQKLSIEAIKAIKDLDAVVTEAAHTHSAAATGKLHYFLLEDVQVRKLQSAAAVVYTHVSSTAKLSTYTAPDFQADIMDVASRLSSSKCKLPSHQLQLIEEFRGLASQLDPSAELSDGMAKAAEQVVRKVIIEVHGPFFNEEILDKEITHLERAAHHLDPITQRSEAACVKLLAATLMNLDGDEPVDDDYDSLAPGGGVDLFLMPTYAPVVRVVDSSGGAAGQGSAAKPGPGGRKQLMIQISGDGSSGASSPSSFLHQQLQLELQQLQEQQQQSLDTAAVTTETPSAASAAAAACPNGSGSLVTYTRLNAAGTAAAAAAASATQQPQLATDVSTTTTMTSIGGVGATAAAAAVAAAIATAAAAVAGSGATGTCSTRQASALLTTNTGNSLGLPVAVAAAYAADACGGSEVCCLHTPQLVGQSVLSGYNINSSSLPSSPAAAAAAAAADPEQQQQQQQLLESFIDNSTQQGTRDSRKACMFHAQMRLPPEGIEKLALFLETSGRVRGLSLAHNWIGPEGMQRLCAAMRINHSVRTLDLPDNKLGDAGAAAIAALLLEGSKITSLQLANNEIGDEGAVALADAILRSKCLEKLSIYGNAVGARGCQALTGAVLSCPSLKVVEFLPGNAAPSRAVKALARAVKQNRKFKICHLFSKIPQCVQA